MAAQNGFLYKWCYDDPWNHRVSQRLPRKGRYKRKNVAVRSFVKRVKVRKNRAYASANQISMECSCNNGCLVQLGINDLKAVRCEYDSKPYNEQNMILLRLMDIRMISRRNSVTYYIMDNNLQKKIICRTAFLKVFGISRKRILTVMRKRIPMSPVLQHDLRGKQLNRRRSLTRQAMLEIDEHMGSYTYDSPHYSKIRNTGSKYMTSDNNLSKCFRDYVAKQRDAEKHNVAFTTFRKYVLSNMDIHFKRPRTDTCSRCDTLTKKIKYSRRLRQKAAIQNDLDTHLKNADRHYASNNFDRNVLALKQPDILPWIVPDPWRPYIHVH